MWCVPEIDQEFVVRMEDVLRLHAGPYREVSRSSAWTSGQRRSSIHHDLRCRCKSGRVRRADYEYVRAGTANVFCIVEPKTGSRLTYASANRTGKAFAHAMCRVARRYKSARRIHMIVDNLNTHRKKSLLDAFGPDAGTALWKRIHYTPKPRAGSIPPRSRPASSHANASATDASVTFTP